MATGKALNGKPYVGKPHIRFDEGEAALSATPRRGSLLYRKTAFLSFVVALSLAAYGETVYTWTGGAGAEGGVYRWGNGSNWQGRAVPASGDDVVLDFGDISNTITMTNDISGLRIRGFRINIAANKSVTMRGQKLTLVGSGGGSSDPDTKRIGQIAYIYMPLEIVGNYTFWSEGNRTYLYSDVTSAADAEFHSVYATCNIYGDWSGFAGKRWSKSTFVLCSEAAAPASLPVYVTPTAGNIWFSLDGQTAHSPVIVSDTGFSGRTLFTVEKSGAWDGEFDPKLDDVKKTVTVKLNSNQSFTYSGRIVNSSLMGLSFNLDTGSTMTLGGSEPLRANNLTLLAPGRLRLARPLDFTSKVIYCYGGGTVETDLPDVLGGFNFLFYASAAVGSAAGTLDLNGCDQALTQLSHLTSSVVTDTGFMDYVITSATDATLTISNRSDICAKVMDKATVCANGCTLTAFPLVAAASTGRFAAKNGGVLDFAAQNCTSVGMGARLYLEPGCKIIVPEGVTLAFERIYIGGVPKLPNVYSAVELPGYVEGGSIQCFTAGPATEGDTFTWKGGTAGDAVAEAANWNEGAPLLGVGSSVLDFTSGTRQAVFPAADSAVFRLVFGGAPFTLSAASGTMVNLYNGGISVTDGAHTNAAPLSIAWAPQTWSVANDASLALTGDIVSGLGGELVVEGPGRLTLSGDNSGCATPIVLTNGIFVTVESDEGLGRAATLHSPDANANSSGTSYIRFKGNRTCGTALGLLGATGPMTDTGASLTLTGRVSTVNGGTTGRTCALTAAKDSTLTFAGGITCDNVYRLFLNGSAGSKIVVRDVPIFGYSGVPTNAEIDFSYSGSISEATVPEVHLDVAGSVWRTMRVIVARLFCGAENALARDGWVLFGRRDWTPTTQPTYMLLDLNGHDQLTCGASTVWAFSEGQSTYNPARYAIVTSSVPATLTMTPTYDYVSSETLPTGERARYGALKFQGEAALHFAPANVATNFILTYQMSDTKGPLRVSSGVLTFARGAGWGGSDRVTVDGTGVLRINADSVGSAFGEHGGDTCLYLSEDGRIDIPAGQTVVVRSVCFGGKYVPGGTYGSAGSGAGNTTYAAYFTPGGGILRSRVHFLNGTKIILR